MRLVPNHASFGAQENKYSGVDIGMFLYIDRCYREWSLTTSLISCRIKGRAILCHYWALNVCLLCVFIAECQSYQFLWLSCLSLCQWKFGLDSVLETLACSQIPCAHAIFFWQTRRNLRFIHHSSVCSSNAFRAKSFFCRALKLIVMPVDNF